MEYNIYPLVICEVSVTEIKCTTNHITKND